MTKALAEAIARRPPRGNATSDVGANNTVATAAASTAAQSLGQVSPGNGSGFYVTMVCTQDAHIRFGISTVAAATASDYLLRAGIGEEFWCESSDDTHFRVIRDTADGTLHWYRSSR
jgi:hypothetical protein